MLNDIATLINMAQAEFAANPYNEDIRVRIQALFDLRNILQTQQLPPEQLNSIRGQLNAIREQISPVTGRSNSTTPAQQQQQQPPVSLPFLNFPPQNNTANLAQQQQQPLFPPNALDALLASMNQGSAGNGTPPVFSLPQHQTAPQPGGAAPATLIDALRAAGILPSTDPPAPVRSPDPRLVSNHTPSQIQPYQPPANLPASIEALTINVDLTPASLKLYVCLMCDELKSLTK
jgi:pre-mRNA cleavage complex 2 protein Pcf11